MNNLFNKTKNITPYSNKSMLSENNILSNEISNTFYGNSSNIKFIADKTVKESGVGPILQLYGKGSENAMVGINLDTFQSENKKNNGRFNGNNPASQILAVDNGQFSSDIIFNTASASYDDSKLTQTTERMRIQSDGNIIINNSANIIENLNIEGNLSVDKVSYLNDDVYITGNLEVGGSFNLQNFLTEKLNVEDNAYFKNNIEVLGSSILNGNTLIKNNLEVNATTEFNDKVSFTNFIPTCNINQFENNNQLVNKLYVDNLISGIKLKDINENQIIDKSYLDTILYGLKPKGYVEASTTSNILLVGIQIIDGYTTSLGDRILVKNQFDTKDKNDGNNYIGSFNNGIYIVTINNWIRSFDYSNGYDSYGSFVYVKNGIVNSNKIIVQIESPGIIGTNPLIFSYLGNTFGNIGKGLKFTDNNNIEVISNLNFVNDIGTNTTSLKLGTTGSNTTINSKLEVIGDTSFEGMVYIKNNMKICGNSFFENIIIDENKNLNLTGSGSIKQDAFSNNIFGSSLFNGTINTGSNPIISTDIISSGTINCNTINCKTLNAEFNNIIQNGSIIQESTANNIFGSTIFSGDVNTDKNIITTGILSAGSINCSNIASDCINTCSINCTTINTGTSNINQSGTGSINQGSTAYNTFGGAIFNGNVNTGNNNITTTGVLSAGSINSNLLSCTNIIQSGSGSIKQGLTANNSFGNSVFNGDIHTTGSCLMNNINIISDSRLNNNIKELNKNYTVDDIKPIIYTKSSTGKSEIGFSADEIEKIYPFLVDEDKNIEKYKSINYMGLIGILVKEIQELKSRVILLEQINY